MSQYFPKPYEPFGGDTNGKVDLSNYAINSDLKDATGIDICTSNFTLKLHLAGLKTEVDKIEVDKFKTAPVDLSKLRNVVDTDKSDLEKKISDAAKKNS